MIKVPLTLKLAVLTVLATGFYAYIGQLVPQKEVQPPEVVEISKEISTEEMVKIGREIFEGKGLCHTCHTIGKTGGPLRFPDLAGVAQRAAHREPGMSALEYFAQTLYEPDAFIVPGFNPGMPTINKPPVGLTDDEILTVIAFLQSLGGEPTVTMDTKLPYAAGGGGPEVAAAPAAVPPATPATGDALEVRGCTECHYTDRPGKRKGEAPSLYDVGARLDRERLLLAVSEHPLTEEGPRRLDELTLAQVQDLVNRMADLRGAE